MKVPFNLVCRALILSLLLMCLSQALLARTAGAAAAITQVEQWGVFELSLDGPSEGNPFLEVELSARFSHEGTVVEVTGFYDGNGHYKIRFMPEQRGRWRYTTQSNHWQLTAKHGVFEAVAPSAKNHGPVGVVNTFHFAYADGTPFKQVGTTSYTWTHRPQQVEQQTLNTLASAPFNKIRMCVFPQTHGIATMPPKRFPFQGKPNKPDYTKFNPEFFQHLEKRVGELRDLQIEADLILFHPYDDNRTWGLDNMPAEVDSRYLKYIVARLSAYRNVWWSMANEFDFIRTKTVADWDKIFKVVMAADPYNHLRSIHNGKQIYDHNKPWVTHVSMQNGFAVTSPGAAQIYRDVYNKPIVYDEVEYEGDYDARWAQLSGQELVHRFWSGTVVGTYVGHSELFAAADDPGKFAWIGQGGTLKGESASRLGFLRAVLEDSPSTGIEPIDKWWNPNIGGVRGEYYLIYFGHTQPQSWVFSLPSKELKDGMKFSAEVIDTWGMTVRPVEGVFELKRADRYSFVDTAARSITLPGKKAMALRIKRWHADG